MNNKDHIKNQDQRIRELQNQAEKDEEEMLKLIKQAQNDEDEILRLTHHLEDSDKERSVNNYYNEKIKRNKNIWKWTASAAIAALIHVIGYILIF